MKKYWKDKWLKALRSGKYTQGGGLLSNEGVSYCCLGVLCDIVVQENDLFEWDRNYDLIYIGDDAAKFDDGTLLSYEDLPPTQLMHYVGLNSTDPEVRVWRHKQRLSRLNDADIDRYQMPQKYIGKDGYSRSLTFLEIADLIEKQIKTEEE